MQRYIPVLAAAIVVGVLVVAPSVDAPSDAGRCERSATHPRVLTGDVRVLAAPDDRLFAELAGTVWCPVSDDDLIRTARMLVVEDPRQCSDPRLDARIVEFVDVNTGGGPIGTASVGGSIHPMGKPLAYSAFVRGAVHAYCPERAAGRASGGRSGVPSPVDRFDQPPRAT